MAQPVWTLSVDLQTKTATFQSGLADAARTARGSFNDIKEGAREMGKEASYSMGEARHGVMLLGEEFGVHIPRGITSFLSSLGPVGAAMEAAFPFLAIIVGATLLLEHLAKLKEEGEKLTESQILFGTTVSNVLNGLDEKLIQAGIKTDDLNHNHLDALNKQLELIDHQSMNELVTAFGVVSKAADATFAELKTSWYQWGAGSAGAKHSLEQFKNEYASLLSQHKDTEANDLLDAKIAREKQILDLQKQAKNASQTTPTTGGGHSKQYEAQLALQKMSVGFTEKELQSQESLVEALQAQVEVYEKVQALKKAQQGNAGQETQNKVSGDADKLFRDQAQSEAKGLEEAEKIREQNYREAVSRLQENEREKIQATKEGSSARLAAIDAAIKEEQSKGLQNTGFYNSLLTSRVDIVRQMAEEQAKVQAEAGKEAAEHEQKMKDLALAAEHEHSNLLLTLKHASIDEQLASDLSFADQEYQVQKSSLEKQIAALDQYARDYENKKKALQDKEKELDQQHQNQITDLEDKAYKERQLKIQASEDRMRDSISSGLSSVLMRHESFTAMMGRLGDQVAAGMLQTALKSIMALNMTKEREAAAAGRQGWLAGMKFPFPANIAMAPALAAMGFASVMAFEQGGIVPGVGKGDTVPAMLEPGEGVLTGKQMEHLSKNAKHGSSGSGGGGDIHVHHHATYNVQAFDSDGVDQVLQEHGDKFAMHAANTIRKMNR